MAGRSASVADVGDVRFEDQGVTSERLVAQPEPVLQEHSLSAKAELLAPWQALRSRFWASPAPVASTDCLH